MDERLGSTHLNLADMNEFSQCLDTCALVDHPAMGCHFTRNNMHGDGLRWAKLDRILISQQWITSLNSTAAFLTVGISDHSSCLVTISDLYTPRPFSFKYLNCWASSPQFQNVVTDGWSSHYYGGHIHSLFQKLKRLRSCLKGIHTTSFTNLSERVADAKQKLKDCQIRLSSSPMDVSLIREEDKLIQDYLTVKRAKLQALQQRAKVRLGSCVLDTLPLADCESLVQPVRVQEILDALRSIDRNKSPGVDGYTSGFFLDAWNVVGQDFKNVVLELFQKGALPKAANTTLLVLIPKMETPLSVKDFRPIACCTIYYKIVSKILANRLRQVLDTIVGPEQAAFVAERDIFDNSMLAHELVSKYGRTYLTPMCLLKVDIRKAFDSVNWDPKFVHWIMACVTSPNYSLLINSGVEGFFPDKCGLRQGDPLSPYLFVICMKILSRLLRRLPRAPNFSYHPKCVQLNLTHLVFADDLLVFTRGDLPSVKAVAKCLELFSEISGLHANPAKTDLYFGGVADGIRDLILAEIGFSAGEFPFKYLGLPLFNARITQDMYQPLLDKIKARIMHWANKSLSYAGKTLLALHLLEGCSTNLKYNTRVMYDSIRSCNPKVSWHNLVHGKGYHPKHSFAGMVVMHNALPTIDNLMRRGLSLVNRCAFCEACSEDVHHIFFNCSYSRHLLNYIGIWLGLSLLSFSLFTIAQDFASRRNTCRQRIGFMATIYYLWNERNARIFKGVKSSVDTLSVKIKKAVHLRLYSFGLS
ncbi:uncharacterized protein LOC141651372 [Silene latifolia]|uniref:uncharacterized protein LOC141651372 n=1 Tax=Silene latifolia TaxID=37657 RepID=UPI003D777A99